MSLNGQLSDLHLSELIEFFCNQRKTGRLKIDYALAPGVFFMHEGELVDAKVGALNGKDAVFFALTLPSATFDFSPGMQSSRRTISEPWASVVLEGLRRIDEGAMPEFDVFGGEDELDEATREYLNCMEQAKAAKEAANEAVLSRDKGELEAAVENISPLSMTVEASHGVGGRSKAMVAGVVGALVLVLAVVAIPVSRKLMRKDAPAAATAQPASEATAAQPDAANNAASAPAEGNATDAAANAAAAEEAARREQRDREARERARKAREEAAKNAAQDGSMTQGGTAANTPKPAAGAKTVRVQITYDEAGRVTQASAVGTSPGAEAYAATAVRIARSRRFAPGKAGATVVTIPIN